MIVSRLVYEINERLKQEAVWDLLPGFANEFIDIQGTKRLDAYSSDVGT
jgi:hypothetical protein